MKSSKKELTRKGHPYMRGQMRHPETKDWFTEIKNSLYRYISTQCSKHFIYINLFLRKFYEICNTTILIIRIRRWRYLPGSNFAYSHRAHRC